RRFAGSQRGHFFFHREVRRDKLNGLQRTPAVGCLDHPRWIKVVLDGPPMPCALDACGSIDEHTIEIEENGGAPKPRRRHSLLNPRTTSRWTSTSFALPVLTPVQIHRPKDEGDSHTAQQSAQEIECIAANNSARSQQVREKGKQQE